MHKMIIAYDLLQRLMAFTTSFEHAGIGVGTASLISIPDDEMNPSFSITTGLASSSTLVPNVAQESSLRDCISALCDTKRIPKHYLLFEAGCFLYNLVGVIVGCTVAGYEPLANASMYVMFL